MLNNLIQAEILFILRDKLIRFSLTQLTIVLCRITLSLIRPTNLRFNPLLGGCLRTLCSSLRYKKIQKTGGMGIYKFILYPSNQSCWST